MRDKKFDEHIKSLMSDHEVPLNPEHWQMFQDQLDMVAGEDASFLDEKLIDQLKNYKANPIPGDWEVMADLLDQADQHFDNDIKESIDSYEAPYDQKTWPILEKKLTYAEIRQRKVFIAKVLEVASVLLFLFTLYNFFPEIKTKVFNNGQGQSNSSHKKTLFTDATEEAGQNGSEETAGILLNGQLEPEKSGLIARVQKGSASTGQQNSEQNQAGSTGVIAHFAPQSVLNKHNNPVNEDLFVGNEVPKDRISPNRIRSQESERTNIVAVENVSQPGAKQELTSNEVTELLTESNTESVRPLAYAPAPVAALLGALHVPLYHNSIHHKLYGQFEANTKRKIHTRVGIHAVADVNILHFPEDNFFSAGNRISFKAQDLPAVGYGGGISHGWYGRRFGVESGIHYSNKSFKPGRQLLIGESLENSKVDFQAVEIDLVSIPLSLSYQVKPTGTFRFYVVGGFDLNIIAQAHYDLNIENNYPLPLSITQSASALASNREAHRVKEHILDGATFNSKSFVTAHAGFGIEKYLNPDLSIFMQPSYLYQVPINRFSNNGGKHFKTLNIRIGTRMPLK